MFINQIVNLIIPFTFDKSNTKKQKATVCFELRPVK